MLKSETGAQLWKTCIMM